MINFIDRDNSENAVRVEHRTRVNSTTDNLQVELRNEGERDWWSILLVGVSQVSFSMTPKRGAGR